MREMPKYQSHKQVWAFKIKSIIIDEITGSAKITPEEDGYGQFGVSHEYVNKHNPKAGGYYVKYENNYESWSPGEVFEAGYTLIK